MFDYSGYSLDKTQADFLESCAQGVEAGVKITVEGILEIGKALSAAREVLSADQDFSRWRQARLSWLDRFQALRFMQVYEKFGCGDSVQHNVAPEKFSITVLYALAAPSTPESVVTDITALRSPLATPATRYEVAAASGAHCCNSGGLLW